MALWKAVFGSSATERPIKTILKEKEFIPGSGFLSCLNMTLAVESNVKTNSFLPSTGRGMNE